jgi:hypothetical protein
MRLIQNSDIGMRTALQTTENTAGNSANSPTHRSKIFERRARGEAIGQPVDETPESAMSAVTSGA